VNKNKAALIVALLCCMIGLSAKAQLVPGDKASDIVLPDTAGKWQKLSEQKGLVTLVDFWASWCQPCRIYNREFRYWTRRFGQRGFNIFAVSIDRNYYPWVQAIQTDSITWAQVNDTREFKGVMLAYKAHYLPTKVLIDSAMHVIAVDVSSYRFECLIDSVLKSYGR